MADFRQTGQGLRPKRERPPCWWRRKTDLRGVEQQFNVQEREGTRLTKNPRDRQDDIKNEGDTNSQKKTPWKNVRYERHLNKATHKFCERDTPKIKKLTDEWFSRHLDKSYPFKKCRPENKIYVFSDAELVQMPVYIDLIWDKAREFTKTLRSVAAWHTAAEIVYDYDGRLYFRDQSPWKPPALDAEFRDESGRWFRYFLEADASGKRPKRVSEKYDRLRYVELTCRLNGKHDNEPA